VLRVAFVGMAIVVGAVGAVGAQAPAPSSEAEQIRARQKIFMMEGALERAVQLGVDSLRRRVRAVMPDDALLQGGVPQVRGFRLEGYGVFFDIEVPALRRSLAWSLRTMNQTGMALARDLAQLRAFVQAITDPRARAEFERTLRRIQQQMGPTPAVPVTDRLASASQGAPMVTAQSMPPLAWGQAVEPVLATPEVDPRLLNDPSEAYTQEVKTAVIDAMIENSGPLVLGDTEWLTVAARDNAPGDPFMTADPDVMTLVLRIKGSDLSAFRAGRLTLEQVRSRVEVGEF